MAEKNLFVKFNTGPSGHGAPPAAGEAMALKAARAEGVKVFAIEGEGGHTAGCWHETKNSAYGLGLDNLNVIMDWNDFGIDPHPTSSIVAGTPARLVRALRLARARGRRTAATGSDVLKALLEMTHGDNPQQRPGMMFGRTRKGRGYYKYDAPSHGSPHKLNSAEFWHCRADFAEKYGVDLARHRTSPRPQDKAAQRQQFADNLNVALDVLRNDEELLTYLADRLVELGDSVPTEIPDFRLPVARNPLHDPALFDFENYPAEMWAKPGAKPAQPRRLRQVGQLGQQLLPAEVRPAPVPGLLRGPGRLDQHLGLRRRLRRDEEHRLVQPREQPRRRDPAPGHHRVRQRGHHGRRRLGELRPTTRSTTSTASSPPAPPTARSAT